MDGDDVPDYENLSFLVSFDLQQKMRLTKNTHAIGNYGGNGPIFGGPNALDIAIFDKCNI